MHNRVRQTRISAVARRTRASLSAKNRYMLASCESAIVVYVEGGEEEVVGREGREELGWKYVE